MVVMSKAVIVTAILVFAAAPAEYNDESCKKGNYRHTSKDGSVVCLPCEDGHFMSEDNHVHRQCNRCAQVTNPQLEVIVSDCTRTHDSVIVCKAGYFRRRAQTPVENDTCVECTMCPDGLFQIRECQTYSDTGCCPDKNHELVDNVCTMTHCGAGHYLNVSANKCFPCPPNTFMNEDNHTYPACERCISIDPGSHVIVKAKCNSTHPGIYECEGGYYSPATHTKHHPECEKCSECNCTLHNCTTKYNTVCCDETPVLENNASTTSLTVAATGVQDQTLCPNGTYLNTSNQICEPCRGGSCMHEVNHTRTACKNYSEINETAIHSGGKAENNGELRDIPFWIWLVVALVVFGVVIIILIYIFRERVRTFCLGIFCVCRNDSVSNDNNDTDGSGERFQLEQTTSGADRS